MNPPGFARVAPAPTIAIVRDAVTRRICSIIAAARAGSRGCRMRRTTHIKISAAATTSTIATHVFGCDGCDDAAASPRTNAATIPIASVAPTAPR
jgi:hypothetical protein